MKNRNMKTFYNQLRPGIKIKGKWNHTSYTILRKLGAGAIGAVYLCQYKGRKAALKISDQRTSIILEVNTLKALHQVQGYRLGPYLLEVDDWNATDGKMYSFYVMEYLQGEKVPIFIRRQGSEWLFVFILQMLDDLHRLHQSGRIFGDLKTENLIVVKSPPRVRWVDVGGVTAIGRSVKEYTEFFDRGYWGLGSRRAEPSYDLFSLVMVVLNIFYPKKFSKTKNPKEELFERINAIPHLRPFRKCLSKALLGKYTTSQEMKGDLLTILNNVRKKQRRPQIPFMSKIVEQGGILLLALTYYLLSLGLP